MTSPLIPLLRGKYRKKVLFYLAQKQYFWVFSIIAVLFFIPAKNVEAARLQEIRNEIVFYSDKLESLDKDSFILKGKVLFIYQNFTLEADYLFLDFKNGFGRAKGNIRAINGDSQIYAEELEFDTIFETIKIKKAQVNLNNIIGFKAKQINLIKNLFQVNGFEFRETDKKNLIPFSILIEHINIFPFFNNKYFFLQLTDINGKILKSGEVLPTDIPAFSTFIRNPTLPKNYINQRRIRGFFEPGSFFARFGVDYYKGAWVSGTVAYFSSDYSNGFLTGEYGVFSGISLSAYQDLTDGKGNLVQFNGLFEQYNVFLKKTNLNASLNFIHDFKYDALNLRLGLNQPILSYDANRKIKPLLVYRLPEISLSSIFRVEELTKIQYRYDFSATRFLVIESASIAQDIGRVRVLADLNSPRFKLTDKINFQLLSETIFSNYLSKSYQLGVAGQIQMNHQLFKNFEYILRYRQRWITGTSPLAFETLTGNQFAGVQLNWWINDFIEVGGFGEFDIQSRRIPDVDLVVNYITDHYTITVLASFPDINFNGNVKFMDF